MKRKKINLKVHRQIQALTDELGSLKEDKYLTIQQIDAVTDELKELYRSIQNDEVKGKHYRSVFESFERKTIDWKALAMSFRPTKVRTRKYTSKASIERIKTFEI